MTLDSIVVRYHATYGVYWASVAYPPGQHTAPLPHYSRGWGETPKGAREDLRDLLEVKEYRL